MGPPQVLWQSVRQLTSTSSSLPVISAHIRCTQSLSSLYHSAGYTQLISACPALASAASSTVAGTLGCGTRRAIVAHPPMHSVRSFASSSSAKPAAANTAASGGNRDGGDSSSGSNSSGSETGQGWRQRMGVLLLVPGTVAALLGGWQLKRRNEKVEMLQNRRAAMEVCFRPPQPHQHH